MNDRLHAIVVKLRQEADADRWLLKEKGASWAVGYRMLFERTIKDKEQLADEIELAIRQDALTKKGVLR